MGPACKSITYFKRRWCSHFSTPCTNTKGNSKAVVLRLSAKSSIATTMKPTTTAAPSGVKPTWNSAGSNAECDGGAGEAYLANSPGKVSSLEQCKTSCENAPACKSITYFKSRWCSHFSTPCTNTKANNKAVVMRLSEKSSIATTMKATTFAISGVKRT